MRRDRRFTAGAFAAIVVAAFVAYGNTLGNGFAYDDHDLLTGNHYLIGWMAGTPGPDGRPLDYVSTMLTSDFARLVHRSEDEALRLAPIGYYRPVILLSYLADTWFYMDAAPWGTPGAATDWNGLAWRAMCPAGFHLTNLLFHAVNALLVFVVARALWRHRGLALAAALVFAVHPITTESVAWISGRTDVIATTFFLAAVWGYVRFRRTGSRRALVASIAAFVVATFAKEIVATLPLLLAGWEWSRRGARPALTRRLVWPALYAAALLPYFAVRVAFAGGGSGVADPWAGIAWADVAVTVPRAFAWYLARLFAPIELDLYPILPFARAAEPATWLGWAALAAAVVGAIAWALIRVPALRVPACCAAAIVVVLQPLNCLVPGLRLLRFEDVGFPVSERFLYIPAIFAACLLGWCAMRLAARAGGAVGWGLVAALVGLGATRTAVRNHHWRDNFALFEATVATSPDSVRMRLNHAAALVYDVWRVEDGIRHLDAAVRYSREVLQKPPIPNLFVNLAHAHFVRGDYDLAADAESEVVLRTPAGTMANNGAVALVSFAYITGDERYLRGAVGHYELAIRYRGRAPGPIASRRFVLRTIADWEAMARAAAQGTVATDAVASAFADGGLTAARGLAADVTGEPWRRVRRGWQVLLVAGETRRRLPAPVFLETRPRTAALARALDELSSALLADLEPLVASLRRAHPESIDLRFVEAEVHRIAGALGDDEARTRRAVAAYRDVLARDADHPGATVGLVRTVGSPALADVERSLDAMLAPDGTWGGEAIRPTPVRAISLARLVAREQPHSIGWHLEPIVRRALDGMRATAARDGTWLARDRLGVALGRAGVEFDRPAWIEEGVASLRGAHERAPERAEPLVHLLQLLPRIGRHGEAKQVAATLDRLRAGGRR